MGTFPTNMNTVVANKAQEYLGDRKVLVHNVDTEKKRPGQTMKALVWHGKKDVRVDEVPVPAITDPGDVICRVTGTTVCGSDLHLYHKEIMQLKKATYWDTSGWAWLMKLGPRSRIRRKATASLPASRLRVDSALSAKRVCPPCAITPTSPPSRTNCTARASGVCSATRASRVALPAARRNTCGLPFGDVNLLKLPDSVPDEKVLYLSDIVPTSYHSTVCAEVKEDKSVAIWGMGPVGLFAAKWSKLAGAKRVIAIDNVPERLAMARDNIGCEVIDFSQTKDVVKVLYEKEPEGINCCIDAAAFRYTKGVLNTFERAVGLETDSSEIVNEMLQAVRKFGHIAPVADYAGPTNGFLIGALMEKGITLRGTGQAPVQMYWHELLKKIEDGSFDPTIILSHRFALEEFAELYGAFDRKEMGIMKTFVQTKFSGKPTPGTPPLSSFKRNDIKPSMVHA